MLAPQALTATPPGVPCAATGGPQPLVHWMYDGPFGTQVDLVAGQGLRARGPRLLSRCARVGWQRCELQLQGPCRPVAVPAAWADGGGFAEVGAHAAAGSGDSRVLYEFTVRLRTGARLGMPFGDALRCRGTESELALPFAIIS